MAELVNMPKLGFDMAEGKLVRWVKAEGDPVKRGEVLAEIETDKATVEVESTFDGTLRRLLVEEGTSVPIGDPIAIIGTPDEPIDDLMKTAPSTAAAAAPTQPKAEEKPVTTGNIPSPGRRAASPLARRMARENNLDLALIKGSGPGGRIVRRDVEAALASKAPASQPGRQGTALTSPTLRSDETLPLERLRISIGRRMSEAKGQIPHFYITHAYKMDALMALRKELNAFLPEEAKLSINDFIVKATAMALLLYPNLNASLNGDQITRHGQINIGVAVAVEGGLLTVVCRNADQKPVRQISEEVRAMAERARQGKVKADDIEGSTFSISNLGMFDVEDFTAIINPPEAAILATGSVKQEPVVEGDTVIIGYRMKATISADHRVTDGAEAARFMQSLAEFLEKPLKLLL